MTALAHFFPDARLVELGKVKIGGLGATKTAKSGNTYRTPEKHDHFTITSLYRNQAGDLIEDSAIMGQLLAKYGEADSKDPNKKVLRQIPIMLLSDNIEDVMQVAYVWYNGKSCAARSDGQTVTWYVDRATGQRLAAPLVEPWKPEYLELTTGRGDFAAPMFKMHTKFSCVVASDEVKWGGVYCFRTTSQITARQLYQSLTFLHLSTGGILTGLPLFMVVRPMQVSPRGKTSTVYVVHVEAHSRQMKQIQAEAKETMRWQLENRQQVEQMRQQFKQLCLPAPGNEGGKEIEEIVAEFVQESTGKDATPAPDPAWNALLGGEQPIDVVATPAASAPQAPPPDTSRAATQEDKEALRSDVSKHINNYCENTGIADPLDATSLISAAVESLLGKPRIGTMDELVRVKAAIEAGQFDLQTGNRIPDDLTATQTADEIPFGKETT